MVNINASQYKHHEMSDTEMQKVSEIHRHRIVNNKPDNECKYERSNIATHPADTIIGNPDSRNSDKERRGEDRKQVESDTTARMRGTFETEDHQNNQGPECAKAELIILLDREQCFPVYVVWTYEKIVPERVYGPISASS